MITRQLAGQTKTRYLRRLLGVAPARPYGPQPRPAGPPSQAAALDTLARADRQIVSIQVRADALRPAARGGLSPVALADAPAQVGAPPAPPAAAAPAFDPYAFSAMAVLVQEGRAGLEARLAAVTSRTQVQALAEAQSIRLEAALLADATVPLAALRAAFIAAVELRLAHRRAVSG